MHELKGNEVSHVFELAWISVWRGAFRGFPNSRVGNQLMMMSIGIFLVEVKCLKITNYYLSQFFKSQENLVIYFLEPYYIK